MSLLRAVDSFKVALDDGPPRVVLAGQEVDEKDPVVKGREAFFIPVEEIVARNAGTPVEAGTANPGQRRNTGRAKAAQKG